VTRIVQELKATKFDREYPTYRTSFLLNHGWVLTAEEKDIVRIINGVEKKPIFWLWHKKQPGGKVLRKTMSTALEISGYVEFLVKDLRARRAIIVSRENKL